MKRNSRRGRLGDLVAGLGLLALGGSDVAMGQTWQGSWAAAPTGAMASALDLPPEWMSPTLNGQTIVQTLRLSGGGERLRLRLSNEHGVRPIVIGRVRVRLLDAAGRALPGSERTVTFSGGAAGTLALRSPLLSDPIDLAAPALARLQVSLYVPGDASPCTCHSDGRSASQISPPGDFTDRPFTPVAVTHARVFLSLVEVETRAARPVVVVLGDSITDGYLSTPDADRRWPDRLAERLNAPVRTGAAVVNVGISGNRLLTEDLFPAYGLSALARFDRDVLAIPGATHLVVLEGINDIGGAPTPSADALIAAYRQLVARAHAHRLKVILATLLPYEGGPYYRPDGERVRAAVNDWIRQQKEADGVIDFDLAVRDPAAPTRMRAALHGGDWLHPNDAGYRTMGDAVDPDLFR